MKEDYGPNIITLTDQDGKEIELEYVDALEWENTTYMAFFPLVEENASEEEEDYGLILLKSELQDGEEILVTIDDEDELDTVYERFMQQLLEDGEEN